MTGHTEAAIVESVDPTYPTIRYSPFAILFLMVSPKWQFFIDVGGTFTDVVARRPQGELITFKLLSSARVRGVAEEGSTPNCIIDRARSADPENFWVGYSVQVLDPGGVSAVT